ncbi:MAG: hypothetical protein FWD75_06500 [Propionibacteriaceae bacterium]|nr:hypothetical protein [Propionibacteriaceae bacterium]
MPRRKCALCGEFINDAHQCPRLSTQADVDDLLGADVEWARYSPTAASFEQLTPEQVVARKEAMWEGRAVAPSYLTTAPGSPDKFWDMWHSRVSQWGDTSDAGYPKMPERYSPHGDTTRRTLRKRYSTPDGFEVHMPSATAVREFAANEALGQTFEMPVAFTTENGAQGLISVRCTWHGPGSWTVEAPAGDAKFGRVTEAVASVLEARYPSTALSDVGDLRERRQERVMRNGSPILPPVRHSTFVTGVSAIGAHGAIVVRIADGRGGHKLYGYRVPDPAPGIPSRERLMAALMGRATDSIGSAFNQMREFRLRVPVDQCPRCLCVYETATGHQCRLHHALPVRRAATDAEKSTRDEAWCELIRASQQPH